VKTVVSITPIAVERDSRTFKQAASMARLGYRSIVVEAEPSRSLRETLPFEVVSIGAAAPEPAAHAERTGDAPSRVPERLRRVAGPPLELAGRIRQYASRCRIVAAALPPGDLYYLHSPLFFPAVRWRTRRTHTPFVYDAHDLYWELRRDGRELTAATRGLWAVWDRVERLCAARARSCVTVGDGVARHAEERFGRHFAVVRNAHDGRLDDAGVTDLRTRLDLRETDFLLAVSGNFKRGLAVEPMLRAIAELPDHVHLAFVGANYEAFAATDRVHFLPAVPPTQIVPLLTTADAAAVPYYPSSTTVRHALPNGFFHAVAAGVPILYPRSLVDLRELAARHALGWEIDPQSPGSIAGAVRTLLEDPDALAGCRGRMREAHDDLSWANEERELARVVAAALDCQNPSR
jgi:glycosyltransferase involved in cell wall biosynthesis